MHGGAGEGSQAGRLLMLVIAVERWRHQAMPRPGAWRSQSQHETTAKLFIWLLQVALHCRIHNNDWYVGVFSFHGPLSYPGSCWHFQMFKTHPTFRPPQLQAMTLAPVKVFGTMGTVSQGAQEELTVLGLALLSGSIRVAWFIDCACQAVCPGELLFQEAPRSWKESFWLSGGIQGPIMVYLVENREC